MKLVAVECNCGHVEDFHLPRFPKPYMLLFCVRCKRVARGVWEPERNGEVWISEKEKEETGWK